MDFKMPERDENSHKGTFGKVLNVAGSDYMSGAALLSSLSALKIGCGYSFLCSTERVISAVGAQTQNIVFAPLKDLAKLVRSCDVLSIGCGMSTSEEAKEIFKTALANVGDVPVVVDADGLNILSQLEGIKLPKQLVLTPHPKEASRLLNISVEEVLADMEKSARAISHKFDCVTVLKSHRTIVCSNDGEIYKNMTGCSALAKAGSGDVLCGMIAGLLAQKMTPFDAAKLGVYLHGLCGEIAAKTLTEYCVLSMDLINAIPDAVRLISPLPSCQG